MNFTNMSGGNLLWISLALLILMASCQKKASKETENTDSIAHDNIEENERSSLLGTWSNLSMTVTTVSPDSIINVPSGHWEEMLQIKPIKTSYNKDGSFISEYRTLGDTVFMTRSGAWVANGDTITMYENDVPSKYHFKIDGDIATFRGYLDWDEDGEEDDLYTGRQRRVEEVNDEIY